MIYKIITDKSVQTIKKEMATKAKESGFGVLGSYEFKKILQSKGFPIQKDITVYELCNPSAAQEALNDMPEISVFLPCRLSIYEENGETVLATINIKDMVNSLDVNEDFKAHMIIVFEYLEKLMKSW
ncbi:DUF302 domain-containing protein [Sulfurimonas paralvinellae]|uniref:DUF302 domain-containing protein n=1 Tax=Sulfurimonas paralvinellae TaxID=317658 RepID=A0A7M1B4Z1_9BACT|nr:DUF302 domain-containing protein [Sulfurimonas paralvinellae]QOP44793.1 DUF302 domain-containing protein [Sulfurimonas paralvinellae]